MAILFFMIGVRTEHALNLTLESCKIPLYFSFFLNFALAGRALLFFPQKKVSKKRRRQRITPPLFVFCLFFFICTHEC